MLTLLPRDVVPEPFNNECLSREFEEDPGAEETLKDAGSVVQDEGKDAPLVEVPREERVEPVIDGELAHIHEHHPTLEVQLAVVARHRTPGHWCMLMMIAIA